MNFLTILEVIESLTIIVRNTLIFSNEAFMWKMTNSSTTFQNVGILTPRETSASLTMILNKLDTYEREILAEFHAVVN